MTLSQLLKECRTGSITAQKYVYDKYVTQMFLVCRRYVKTDSIAEECMLNGFLKFFKSLNKFEYQTDGATTAWLKKIMINECLQQLRQKNSFLLTTEDEAAEISIEEEAINNLSADEIFKVITQLPLGYRTVFNLYVIDGMSHKEIATELRINEGTSKSQLSKAKQMLQSLLVNLNADYATRKIN
jgi:RNA polymerase sigma-70 factor (ECF subfamily)